MTDSPQADLEIWGVRLPAEGLSEEARRYLGTLPIELPNHEWVCSELDRVWHSLGLDNRRPLYEQPIDDFYNHPVWIMNGIFSAADPVSRGHRGAIASYIEQLAPSAVADLGGGFGELARRLGEVLPEASITIIEPFPSELALMRLEPFPQISFESTLERRRHDVIVAQDVLEHVDEPLTLAAAMSQSVRPSGHVIFANNFNPVIECHLPSTFHLRHTFRHVMHALGLTFIGFVPGASHAEVFRVPEQINLDRAVLAERFSKLLGPAMNLGYRILSGLRRGGASIYRTLRSIRS